MNSAQHNPQEEPPKKIRIALFTVMGVGGIKTVGKVLAERPGTELALVVTSTGSRHRRSPAHIEVLEALYEEGHHNVDVIVSNKRSKYGDLCAMYDVDMIITVGFPWLLPKSLIEDPRIQYGAINFHNAALPEGRGPNALGHAIMNGDTTMHFVYHRMAADFDTGPILVRGQSHLGTNEHFDGLFLDLPLLAQMTHEAIDKVKAGDPGEAQVGKGTHVPKFEPEFRWMNFNESALHNHNKVRAFYGSRDIPKGALAKLFGKVICITKSRVDLDDVNDKENMRSTVSPGTITFHEDKNSHFDIQCGDGVLHILEWQESIQLQEQLGARGFRVNAQTCLGTKF